MRTALLVELFQQLPALPEGDFLATRSIELQPHLDRFRQRVSSRYTESTLQRLLEHQAVQARRAALLALGLMGTIQSNPVVAACLHDGEPQVRSLAADALWNIWFRAEGDTPKRELQRLSQLPDAAKALRGLNNLIQKYPAFAEAYNQRAIVYFRVNRFHKAIADCERTLMLNGYHFAACAGMARCYMELSKPKAALKALRRALQINPELDDVADSIRSLEQLLGGE